MRRVHHIALLVLALALAGIVRTPCAAWGCTATQTGRHLQGSDAIAPPALLPAPHVHQAPPGGRLLFCLPALQPQLRAWGSAASLRPDIARPSEPGARFGACPARAPPPALPLT